MPSRTLVAASLKPFVLAILSNGPNYGYEIIQRVSEATDGHLKWTTGSLYPLLHQMESQRLLESYWVSDGPGPRRKYYRLSKKGALELAAERRDWDRINRALSGLWGDSPTLAGV